MTGKDAPSDITIIGGGIIGTALAYRLATQGHAVRLLDRRAVGQEASWASAGILSPPGPRHLTRVGLALESYRSYPALIREVEDLAGLNVGYVPSGEIDLGTDADADTLRETMRWQHEHGMQAEWLDETALHEREPALHRHFTCGLFTPEAGSVLLGQLTVAFARAAARRGADIREHQPVTGILISGGRATGVQTFAETLPTGTVVIAAGAWSRMLGESIDFTIPTVPVRGQMMAIADPPLPLSAVISGAGGYLVPRADGTIAVGATEEHDAGFDTRVTPAGIAELTELVERVAPALVHGRLAATWAGLRPGTLHGELIAGRIPHLENVWVATGHYRSGALLAPATADALAASITSGTLDPRLAAFDPGRLAHAIG
jgi:glycine oxidase